MNRRKYILIVATVTLCAVLSASPAQSAEISCVVEYKGTGRGILVRGDIVKGDYARLDSLLRKGEVGDISLISHGGDAIEAMRMGRRIRQLFLTTSAPKRGTDGSSHLEVPTFEPPDFADRTLCKGPECASACALMWWAGVQQYGDAVIVHRPYSTDRAFADLPYAESRKLYDGYLLEMKTFLEEMEVPAKYYQQLVATPSNEGAFIEIDATRAFFSGFTQSTFEWLQSKCKLVSAHKTQRFAWLRTMEIDELSAEEKQEINELHQAVFANAVCIGEAMNGERSRVRASHLGNKRQDAR